MYRHVPLYRLYLVYKIGCKCKQPVIFDSLFNRKVRTSGTTVHLYGTEQQLANACSASVRASGTGGTKKSLYRVGIFVNYGSKREPKIKKNKKFEREGYIYHSTARRAPPLPPLLSSVAVNPLYHWIHAVSAGKVPQRERLLSSRNSRNTRRNMECVSANGGEHGMSLEPRAKRLSQSTERGVFTHCMRRTPACIQSVPM